MMEDTRLQEWKRFGWHGIVHVQLHFSSHDNPYVGSTQVVILITSFEVVVASSAETLSILTRSHVCI
jgi:hypothetical protein